MKFDLWIIQSDGVSRVSSRNLSLRAISHALKKIDEEGAGAALPLVAPSCYRQRIPFFWPTLRAMPPIVPKAATKGGES